MSTEAPVGTFTKMDDATPEELAVVVSEAHRHLNAKVADRILEMLETLKGPTLGYLVDRYEHSLQTATRAHREGARVDMVVGALLHDIGDALAPANHSELAATIISPYVDAETAWVVGHHGVFQGYHYWHKIGFDRNARGRPRREESSTGRESWPLAARLWLMPRPAPLVRRARQLVPTAVGDSWCQRAPVMPLEEVPNDPLCRRQDVRIYLSRAGDRRSGTHGHDRAGILSWCRGGPRVKVNDATEFERRDAMWPVEEVRLLRRMTVPGRRAHLLSHWKVTALAFDVFFVVTFVPVAGVLTGQSLSKIVATMIFVFVFLIPIGLGVFGRSAKREGYRR